MGGHPPLEQGPGGVPGPGGAAFDEKATTAENRREVGVHLDGNGKGGGGFSDDGGIHSAKAEHGRAVHCYAIASGPV